MRFGLIGRSLQHSFSKDYFTSKFKAIGANHSYSNFELEKISVFPELLKQYPDLGGLNVTIPYKEKIIPFLSSVSDEASEIGAVNTIVIRNGESRGYNTDVYGFEESLKPLLQSHHTKALVLGTGGASKAVTYVLEKLGITVLKVSRKPAADQVSYHEAAGLLMDHLLIINTTPLGTFPEVQKMPPLDVHVLTPRHLCYDLIYNPPQTLFLQKAAENGSGISNGREMLELQAEKAWEIWNEF